jgi:serine/threonine protein phosphatase PrpC
MAYDFLCVQVAALTHCGKVRDHNEDTIVVDQWIGNENMAQPAHFETPIDRPVLLLVADGMGGHVSGEVASRYVAECMSESVRDMSGNEEDLTCGLRRVNDGLYGLMDTKPEYRGMGTTVAGLILTPEGVLIFNVGDSRVYRRQNGYLAQLSVDDSADSADYAGHDDGATIKSNVLTQSLGGTAARVEILPHVQRRRLEAGRHYLLCSDGLTDMVRLDSMEGALGDDLDASCGALFEKAMMAGGEDNISIVVVRVGRGSENKTELGSQRQQ